MDREEQKRLAAQRALGYVEEGSIIGASERISISPPSISMAVSSLEREFGVQLSRRFSMPGKLLSFSKTLSR